MTELEMLQEIKLTPEVTGGNCTDELASLYYPLLGLSYAFLGVLVLLLSDRIMSQLLINSHILQPFKETWIALICGFMLDTFIHGHTSYCRSHSRQTSPHRD